MNFFLRTLPILLLQVCCFFNGIAQQGDSAMHRKFVVGQIVIMGNYVTKSSIIKRELTFKTGDTVMAAGWAEIALRSKNNLMNTSLFNFVSIDTVRMPQGQVDAVIKVQERWYLLPAPILKGEERNFNTWWVQDHHQLDKIDYGLYLTQNNVFGYRQVLKLIAQFGYTEDFGASYSIPYISKKQTSGLQFSFNYTLNHEIPYTSIGNILTYLNTPNTVLKTEYDASVGYSYRQGLYNTYYVEADYYNCTIADTIAALTKDYLPGNQVKAAFPEIKFTFKRDMRDYAPYPLEGYFFNAGIYEYGMGLRINDQPFNLFYFHSSFRKYWMISPRFYYSASAEGKISQNGAQPYLLEKALGYSNTFVRGYELYVMDGNNYALVKNEIRYRLINVPFLNIPSVLRMPQFTSTYFAIYLTAFSDWGYVGAPDPNVIDNNLSNKPLWGNGFGIDLVTYYNLVMRVEYSFNQLGQKGFFLHFLAPM